MPLLSDLRALGVFRALTLLILGFVVAGSVAAWILAMAIAARPVPVHIRWKPDVSDAQRSGLERQFHLLPDHHTEGTTWAYQLTDPSTDTIRAIVQDPRVDDTAHLNRIRFRPEFANDRERRIIFYSALIAGVGAVAALVVGVRVSGRRRKS